MKIGGVVTLVYAQALQETNPDIRRFWISLGAFLEELGSRMDSPSARVERGMRDAIEIAADGWVRPDWHRTNREGEG